MDVQAKIENEKRVYEKWATTSRLGRFDIVYLEAFKAKIDTINRKAAKLGLPPVQMKVLGEWHKPFRVGYDVLMERNIYSYIPMTRVILTGQIVKIAGWQFAAKLEHLDGANLVRSMPNGLEIPERFRTSKPHCEHCKTKRYRKDTYLLYKSGEFKQVGSNCLGDFTGANDPQKFARQYEYLILAQGAGDDDERESGGFRRHMFRTSYFLACAARVIREHGWRAKSDPDVLAGVKASTFEQATDLLASTDHPLPEDGETAEKVIAWAKKVQGENRHMSEYEFNLVTLLTSEFVGPQHFGIVASGVNAYNRAMEKALKDTMPKLESGYLGKVGDKMEFDGLTCLSSSEMEGRFGFTTIIRMVDKSGNIVVWFASGRININRGDVVKGKATIKNLEEYRDVKQTVITRFKWECVSAAEQPEPEGMVIRRF